MKLAFCGNSVRVLLSKIQEGIENCAVVGELLTVEDIGSLQIGKEYVEEALSEMDSVYLGKFLGSIKRGSYEFVFPTPRRWKYRRTTTHEASVEDLVFRCYLLYRRKVVGRLDSPSFTVSFNFQCQPQQGTQAGSFSLTSQTHSAYGYPDSFSSATNLTRVDSLKQDREGRADIEAAKEHITEDLIGDSFDMQGIPE